MKIKTIHLKVKSEAWPWLDKAAIEVNQVWNYCREVSDKALISGNISSVKMTPEETAKEIAEVTEGVFAVAGEPTIVVLDKIENGIGHFHVEPKKKRGWPKGKKRGPRKVE